MPPDYENPPATVHLSVITLSVPITPPNKGPSTVVQPSHSAVDTLKATALALGSPTQPKFHLSVTERQGSALGVITQLIGPPPQPAQYLSKELEQVAKGAYGQKRKRSLPALVRGSSLIVRMFVPISQINPWQSLPWPSIQMGTLC